MAKSIQIIMSDLSFMLTINNIVTNFYLASLLEVVY